MNVIETLEKEVEKLEQAALQIEKNTSPSFMPQLQPSGVVQSVKLVVKLLGTVETLDISEALDGLKDCCQKFLPQSSQVSDDYFLNKMITNSSVLMFT